MMSYKSFLTSVIIFSFIIQSGSILLNKTKFEDIFKTISGIIAVIFVLSSMSSCSKSFDFSYIYEDLQNKDKNSNCNSELITSFENNLKSIIEDDLHKKYYVNLNVKISTDLKTLKIYIYSNDNSINEDVRNYVKQKYCQAKDEVTVINENA
ncbi:MAG: hypothetical protein IKJ68_08205 [Clostridia bacterium]|nr:hypothetical protein [Clostridia bacterium]